MRKFSMSAEDTVRNNKTAIQRILSGDYRLILNKVYEKNLITHQEYNNLKWLSRDDVEGHVIELVDKIMNKGEDVCKGFLTLLHSDDEIKTTFPNLKNLKLNINFFPPKLVQTCSAQHDDSNQVESLQVGAGGSSSVIQRLSSIEEELDSSEVAALCFLCRDVVNRCHLEEIRGVRGLFLKLMEKGLLQNNHFLSQLLSTIERDALLRTLETDIRQSEESDAGPVLSEYRVMLYRIYDIMNNENLIIMKFLLRSKLSKGKLDRCNTALDVFAEMEKKDLISEKNVSVLREVLQELDPDLTVIIEDYIRGDPQQQRRLPPHRVNDPDDPHLSVPITETQPSCRGESIRIDAQPRPPSHPDQSEYYTLTRNPCGLCVVFNNEIFTGSDLKNRRGTQKDADALNTVFTRLGFKVVIHNNLSAAAMLNEIRMLSKKDFVNDDALVVCILSHGDKGYVFGTDSNKVFLKDLTFPFTSGRAPTLAGKPKLFFIEASQGDGYQRGFSPCHQRPGEDKSRNQGVLAANAGRVYEETLPSQADFLIGMATVEECRSFRNTLTGCIYTQELCRQLARSAESQGIDDILTVLTRVNREVSRGNYGCYKQMPEPKYTLTKKLVLKHV